MQTRRVCLIYEHHELLIEEIVRSSDGKIVDGLVVNGEWYLNEVPHILDRPHREVPIPDDMRGDYNELIEWAKKNPAEAGL